MNIEYTVYFFNMRRRGTTQTNELWHLIRSFVKGASRGFCSRMEQLQVQSLVQGHADKQRWDWAAAALSENSQFCTQDGAAATARRSDFN